MSDINKTSISLYDLLICITNAGDLVRPELEEHHQRVAYIAYQIADHMGMPITAKKDLVLAGLLHDIGTLTLHERLELLENEPRIVHDHAFRGARLIERFQPLSDAAGTILHHHVPWNYGAGSTFMGEPVRMESHILHLADRIAVMVRKDRDILEQVGSITAVYTGAQGFCFRAGARGCIYPYEPRRIYLAGYRVQSASIYAAADHIV